MSSAPRSSGAPEKIGPYRLEARLGSGGMGEVYRAYDERLRRRVAIKQVLAKAAQKANVRRRFRREARTAARLNHSAIVRIYDILETEEGDWIVMELVEGRTVRELMDRDELTLEMTLRLARQVAGGLVVAHDHGIVHRDLKVENVMVTEQGHAKILDFGLAKRLAPNDPGDTTLSGIGMVMGTFRAMSPEQIMQQDVDARSDLFSFGTLLYEMCTGVSPFKADNVVTTMTRVCRYQQEPARTVNGELRAELSDFIDRLLEKDPVRRPQSAHEVVSFLDELTGDVTIVTPLDALVEAVNEAPEDDSLPFAPTVSMETAFLPGGAVSVSDGARGPAVRGTAAPAPSPEGDIAIKTLVATELMDRAGLAERLDDAALAKVLGRLGEIRARLAAEHGGLQLDRQGEVLLMFERPAAAVEFALAYRRQVAGLTRELGEPVAVRTGIHLGEVVLTSEQLDESTRYSGIDLAVLTASEEDAETQDTATEIGKLTPLVTRSVMTLARTDQILFTQSVDELVKRGSIGRQFGEQEVAWKDHGLYRVPGVEEEVEVFEVGFVGDAPFSAPEGARTVAYSNRESSPSRGWLTRGFGVGTLAVALLLAGLMWFQGCPR